ncbi:MAG: hypothetical protein ABEJ04_05980 [Halobacteriaceae archaeon]
MRRIYESEALRRDDDDPFVPGQDDGSRSRSRSLNWDNASHAFMPNALRSRAIDVTVQTNEEVYRRGETVHFHVAFRNRLPLPVALKTTTLTPWTWEIDGLEHASKTPDETPDEAGRFQFNRAERKTFSRRWTQRFQETENEWSSAPPGEYRLAVRINAAYGTDRLQDSTTFRIE